MGRKIQKQSLLLTVSHRDDLTSGLTAVCSIWCVSSFKSASFLQGTKGLCTVFLLQQVQERAYERMAQQNTHMLG